MKTRTSVKEVTPNNGDAADTKSCPRICRQVPAQLTAGVTRLKMAEPPIVLLGPMGAGKSTIASLLSETLRLPRCCYDELKLDYLVQEGFDLTEAQRLRDTEGVYEMCMYTNQFGISVLERLLKEYPGHIIDLGAGSYCFENESQIARARRAFETINYSFLLKPSPDLGECITNLPGVRERRYMNTYFTMHPLNEVLSTHTVYTLGKTPEETATDVAVIVKGRGA